MKLALAVVLTCIISLALPVPGRAASLADGLVTDCDLRTYQLGTDSTFEEEPEVIYGENKTCFSHWYEQGFRGTDQNVVCLNWTHRAGDWYNMSYLPPYLSGPEVSSYVGLRIPLAFPYNSTPLGLRGNFTARILATGDFAVHEWPYDMCTYIVTESGTWYWLDFRPPAQEEGVFSPSPFLATRQFFENGAVDDMLQPNAILGHYFEIVLLLLPSWSFVHSENGGWRSMSGTVAIEVCGFSAEILMDHSTPAHILQPYRGESLNLTYGWPRGHLITDPSGASYCIFRTEDNAVIVKWDGNLKLAYTRALDMPDAYFTGIYYHEGRLYCYGQMTHHALPTISAFLVCTDLEASVLWSHEYIFGSSAYAERVETDRDHSLLITGSSYSGHHYSWVMAVLVDGTPIWNVTFPEETVGFYDISAVRERRVYGVSSVDGVPVCYSLDGELLWRGNTACIGMTVGQGGHIYSWTYEIEDSEWWMMRYRLLRLDSEGRVLWNRSLEVTHPGGWDDSPYLATLDVGPDGRLFAILVMFRYLSRAILYSVGPDGKSETTRTLFDSTSYGSPASENPVFIRESDGFLLVLTQEYSDTGKVVYTILRYENWALSPSGDGELAIVGTMSAVALLVGWVLYDRFRGRAPAGALRHRVRDVRRST